VRDAIVYFIFESYYQPQTSDLIKISYEIRISKHETDVYEFVYDLFQITQTTVCLTSKTVTY